MINYFLFNLVHASKTKTLVDFTVVVFYSKQLICVLLYILFIIFFIVVEKKASSNISFHQVKSIVVQLTLHCVSNKDIHGSNLYINISFKMVYIETK
jgi:hypothetical protein